MNYELFNKLEKQLTEERIAKIKRTLMTMVDKPKEPFKTALMYKGNTYKLGLKNYHAYKTVLVTDEDTQIVDELSKWINIEKQIAQFKQLFTQACIRTCLPATGMLFLLGEVNRSMLIDEAICTAQAYNEDHPELLKLYRRLKLMAGNA